MGVAEPMAMIALANQNTCKQSNEPIARHKKKNAVGAHRRRVRVHDSIIEVWRKVLDQSLQEYGRSLSTFRSDGERKQI